MFNPHKNSYLQLVCAMNPRIINKAVDRAMKRMHFDPHTELPAAHRLESMQPSLYCPNVDITRASLGFGRVGLRILNRELHSKDSLVQLQALHSIMDQLHKAESAMFLIDLNIVYRLIDLIKHPDPVFREKVCLTLMQLASYHQGRKRIMTRPVIIEDLMWLWMRDRKEIRYAAAYTIRTLSRDRCACEMIMQNETIVENLLKMVKSEHVGITLLHLKSLENLLEWDPVRALKANGFQIMMSLFRYRDPRVQSGAMDVMTQLCKHDVGMKLADNNDMTFFLRPYLISRHIEVVISAVGLMMYTTITTRSKWRAKECALDLTKRLVNLCLAHNKPQLQIRCMQVLINLCDCPDIRYHMKEHLERQVLKIKIRTHEQWDGTSETTSFGLETGHNYRTMCIEGVETIKNDYGDNAEVLNVHSYLRRVQDTKDRLIRAINYKPYKCDHLCVIEFHSKYFCSNFRF